MAIIINFQEYVNLRKKRNDNTKVSSILNEGSKIIYFNREDVSL